MKAKLRNCNTPNVNVFYAEQIIVCFNDLWAAALILNLLDAAIAFGSLDNNEKSRCFSVLGFPSVKVILSGTKTCFFVFF